MPKRLTHTEGAGGSQGVCSHPVGRGPACQLFSTGFSHICALASLSCSEPGEPGALTGQLLLGFHQGKTGAGRQRAEGRGGRRGLGGEPATLNSQPRGMVESPNLQRWSLSVVYMLPPASVSSYGVQLQRLCAPRPGQACRRTAAGIGDIMITACGKIIRK